MAFDSRLYLRDSAVSSSLFAPLSTGTVVATPKILLPGVPLRGLNVNVITTAAVSTPSLVVSLMGGVSTGATLVEFARLPAITTVGDYNYRFNPPPGYFAVGASLSLAGATGAGLGNVEVRIGMDLGAHGNSQGTRVG